jgi:hypothetical protein
MFLQTGCCIVMVQRLPILSPAGLIEPILRYEKSIVEGNEPLVWLVNKKWLT